MSLDMTQPHAPVPAPKLLSPRHLNVPGGAGFREPVGALRAALVACAATRSPVAAAILRFELCTVWGRLVTCLFRGSANIQSPHRIYCWGKLPGALAPHLFWAHFLRALRRHPETVDLAATSGRARLKSFVRICQVTVGPGLPRPTARWRALRSSEAHADARARTAGYSTVW